jgi:hypothetical protein
MRLTCPPRLAAALCAAALCGCSRTDANAHPATLSAAAFVNLPLDSLVQTLGPAVGRNGISVSPMQNNAFAAGRYEWDYSLEFTAPERDAEVVHAIATRLRDLAPLRGVRVTGYTISADAGIESFSYETRSARGWVSVMSLKPRRERLDHFLVSVRELELPSP